MKRTSLVAPLILILIGGLFLLNNLRPELPLLELAGRYWPFLLIGWGVLRLAEILAWAAQSRPMPARGISGGEWALVVLICLIGSGLFFARRVSADWPQGRITMRGIEVFGEAYDFPLEAHKPVGKSPRLVVENLRGNARIVGGDGEEVKVTGRKTIRALQQSDADKVHEMTPLEIVVQGDQVIVRTNQERASGERRVSIDLEIAVPRAASVACRGRYGDFDVSEIAGNVEVDSDNAGVRVQNIGGGLRVELRRSDIVRAIGVKGSVDLKGRGQDVELENIGGAVTVNASYSGELQFRNLAKSLRFESSQTDLSIERLPGQLRIGRGDIHGSQLVGPVRLTARSKDVQFSDFTQTLEISLERGDIDLRPGRLPLAKTDVKTRSGDIELALPDAARFDLRASTNRGEVRNDFGAPLKEESEGRGASLRGLVGQGPTLTATTDRGVVTVRKSTAADMVPPEAPEPPKPPKPLQVERQ